MTVTISGDAALKRKFDTLSKAAQGKAQERALIAGALLIQNEAKRRVKRVTSNLARSIHIGGHEELNPEGSNVIDRTGSPVPGPEVSNNSAAVYVGTDVVYARRIEFGFMDTDALGRTYHQPAQPYMRPAVDTTKAQVQREVAEAFRELIKAAAK